MNRKDIEDVVLWLGVEDSSGIWEALWELNSRYPNLPEAERIDCARKALNTLVGEDYVNLSRCSEASGDMTVMPKNDALLVVSDTDFKQPTLGAEETIRIVATDKGRDRALSRDR